MSAFSNYLENSLITHIFRTASYTKPTTLAIALLTTAAVDGDTGAFSGTGVEVANANGYARQTLNPSDSNWAAPSGGNGVTSNLATVTFPRATGSWGNVVGLAVVDSATYGQGNLLFYGALATPRTIDSGTTLSFEPGDLVITLS